MASRFEDVTDSDVAALKDAAENLNTRKSTVNWLRVFENWCDENTPKKALRSFLLNSWIKLLSGFMPLSVNKTKPTTNLGPVA